MMPVDIIQRLPIYLFFLKDDYIMFIIHAVRDITWTSGHYATIPYKTLYAGIIKLVQYY